MPIPESRRVLVRTGTPDGQTTAALQLVWPGSYEAGALSARWQRMAVDTKPAVGREGFHRVGFPRLRVSPFVNAVLKFYRNQIDLLM